jgi:hypothetical protein
LQKIQLTSNAKLHRQPETIPDMLINQFTTAEKDDLSRINLPFPSTYNKSQGFKLPIFVAK